MQVHNRGEILPINSPENRRLIPWSINGDGADQPNSMISYLEPWRRRADSNRRIGVLQTPALDRLATSPGGKFWCRGGDSNSYSLMRPQRPQRCVSTNSPTSAPCSRRARSHGLRVPLDRFIIVRGPGLCLSRPLVEGQQWQRVERTRRSAPRGAAWASSIKGSAQRSRACEAAPVTRQWIA